MVLTQKQRDEMMALKRQKAEEEELRLGTKQEQCDVLTLIITSEMSYKSKER